MIFTYILIILFNLYILLYKKKKKNYFFINFLNFANISSIILNIFYYLITFIYTLNINYIDLILFFISILSYIPIILLKKNKIKKESNLKKEEKNINLMINLTFLSYLCIQRAGEVSNTNISALIYAIIIIFILISCSKIVNFLIDNKHIVTFKEDEENDFLKDVRFTTKITLNSFYNYIIYIFAYVLFIYIKIPFYYIIYPLIILLLIYIIYKKIKKIKNQSKKLYNNISLLKEKPGINYAFQFNRDILFTKNIMLATIYFILTIIIYFSMGITAFTYLSIELYIILIYIILFDKKNNIYNIYSLNDEFIDKKRYQTTIDIKISDIKQIKVFKTKFYKIICVTENNIKYESNIILYDPELYIDKVKVYININNIDDYIIITNELYM